MAPCTLTVCIHGVSLHCQNAIARTRRRSVTSGLPRNLRVSPVSMATDGRSQSTAQKRPPEVPLDAQAQPSPLAARTPWTDSMRHVTPTTSGPSPVPWVPIHSIRWGVVCMSVKSMRLDKSGVAAPGYKPAHVISHGSERGQCYGDIVANFGGIAWVQLHAKSEQMRSRFTGLGNGLG
jgi:hypothetical protein